MKLIKNKMNSKLSLTDDILLNKNDILLNKNCESLDDVFMSPIELYKSSNIYDDYIGIDIYDDCIDIDF